MNIEFDATFWALVAFLIFFAVALYFKAPALLAGMLDERSQAIAKELQEARRLREEAERMLADYTAKQKAAEADAKQLIETAQQQAALVASDARAQAADTIARRQKQAEDRIAQAEAKATADVRAAAVEAAVAAAEKILRERVDAGVQAQLVDAGVADLKKRFG
jgi:F-type H+-transporting ATPase subunit b